jgi:hypothetical protein
MVSIEPENTHPNFTFDKNNRDHLHNEIRSEISTFVTCNCACPTQCRVACTKPRGRTFRGDSSDCDEDHGQQEGENSDCDMHFEQVGPRLNPI